MSEEKHRQFFLNVFTKVYGLQKFDEYIKLPITEEELCHVMGYYKQMGAPGCAGLIDCVHVVWDYFLISGEICAVTDFRSK